MLWQTEVAVPPWNQHHVIPQVFALYFQFLHNHNIRLKDIEHAIEGSLISPWLIPKWIPDPIHIPCRDAHLEQNLRRLIANARMSK